MEEAMCGVCQSPCTEYVTKGSTKVCPDCITYKTCVLCDRYRARSLRETVDGRICRSCYRNLDYFGCLACESVVSSTNGWWVEPSGRVCLTCKDDHYAECERCEIWIHQDDVYYGRNDEQFCRSCYRRSTRDADREYINGYEYRPAPKFHPPHNPKNLYLGFELEMEGSSTGSCARDLIKKHDPNQDFFYLKYDGSLSNGFELVTHPMTLAYNQNEMNWDRILRTARSHSFRSHTGGRCGLHVHVGRDFLSRSEQVKLGIFVNTHEDEMSIFARRTRSSWARFKKLESTDKYKDAAQNRERYEALNWQNTATVEFRLWRGSLRLETMMATLEMTDAIVRYIKAYNTYEISQQKQSWTRFMKYVNEAKKTYPNILPYMERIGLIEAPKEV